MADIQCIAQQKRHTTPPPATRRGEEHEHTNSYSIKNKASIIALGVTEVQESGVQTIVLTIIIYANKEFARTIETTGLLKYSFKRIPYY